MMNLVGYACLGDLNHMTLALTTSFHLPPTYFKGSNSLNSFNKYSQSRTERGSLQGYLTLGHVVSSFQEEALARSQNLMHAAKDNIH